MSLSKYIFYFKLFDKMKLVNEMINNREKVITLTMQNCIYCLNHMQLKIKNRIFTYNFNGSSFIYYSTAFCHRCRTDYMPDYYERDNKKFFYSHETNKILPYILTSTQTSFDVKLLKWYDINLVRNITSFSGFVNAYSEFFNEEMNLSEEENVS